MNIVDTLLEEIAVINTKITSIQDQCSHPEEGRTKKHGSNAGGYDDPRYDKYWTDFTCTLCKKRWTEDGSK